VEIVEFLEKKLGISGKLAPSGWYRACCPIHGEKSPSFAVLTEYPYPFKCLSCGAGGQLPYLTSRVLNMPMHKAREFVLDHIKITVNPTALFHEKQKPDPIPDVLLAAYEGALKSSRTSKYCRGRGIPRFVLESFGVGHDQLHLQMMIPMRSVHSGVVLGFETRGFFAAGEAVEKSAILADGAKKEVVLAPQGYLKKRRAIVVEGFFDAARVFMWLLRSGKTDYTVVGFGGVGISDTQLKFISRYDRVILGYDFDKAGAAACRKMLQKLDGIPLYRLLFDGEDPGASSLDSFDIELYL
jgi:DNA primase